MARLRLFAGLREIAGTGEADLPGGTVGEVLDEAVERFGTRFQESLVHARVWVNGDPAEPTDRVTEGDELALIPPVSGGAAAVETRLNLEVWYLPALVAVLAVTTIVDSRAWFAAATVGVAAVWAIDLVAAANARLLGMSETPILGAVFVAAVAAHTQGSAGLGLAAATGVVLTAAWAILVLRDRDLVAVAATMMVAVLAALAVGGLVLVHAPGATGNARVGAFLLVVVAAGLVSWALSQASGRPMIDPVTGGSLAGVGAALIAAWLWEINLAAMLVVGIGLIVALIAGRGLGSLIRTGNVYLVDRLPGLLVPIDGPVLAAAVLYPMMRMLL